MTWIMKLMNAGALLQGTAQAGQDAQAFGRVAVKNRKGDSKTPPKSIHKLYDVTESDMDGFPLFILQGGEAPSSEVIFFLHGGAYVTGPSQLHWGKVDEMARRSGFDAALLDYPKTPEQVAETTIPVTLDAYCALADQYGAENITLMGDSAGGGLALALVMELQARGDGLPRQLVLFSPWLDVSMSHPEAREYEADDILLNCDGLIACGQMYAGALDMQHPWVSPKFGELGGLPPLHLFVGGREVFWPDVRDFAAEAEAAGLDVSLTYEPYMQHDYPLFPMLPEAQAAIDKVVAVLAGGL